MNGRAEFDTPIKLKPWRDWKTVERKKPEPGPKAPPPPLRIVYQRTPWWTRPILNPKTELPLVPLAEIMRMVCEGQRVHPEAIKSAVRTNNFLFPRHLVCYLAARFTSLSFVKIGEFIGGRDHTTIMSAHRKMQQLKEDYDAGKLVNEPQRLYWAGRICFYESLINETYQPRSGAELNYSVGYL